MVTFRKDMNHVLVLQGGGALGAYQAGAFEAMAVKGYRPDYVAGISIGAINSALIAGNRPEHRVERLRAFWELVSRGEPLSNTWIDMLAPVATRGLLNDMHASQAMFAGVQGFYLPRNPAPFFNRPGTAGAVSFYDTAPLRETLLELVDFDYLNSGKMRFAVGAVNIETGNQIYFDNKREVIRPEHIMASGALPPGFPPVVIDGASYWDGGILSNTPLQYVLDNHDPDRDMTIFQFDLFNARGKIPETIMEIESREKDIRFSSRTRYSSDQITRLMQVRAALTRVLEQLPDDVKSGADAKLLMEARHAGRLLLVQMIYNQADYEKASKDYEFSRRSMLDHWRAGTRDAESRIGHADWIAAQMTKAPFTVIDPGKLPRPDASPRRKAS